MKKKRTSSAADASPDLTPTLPAWKAFVVQFSHESGPHTKIFAGRVEHLSSGRRVRFASPPELVTILQQLLQEICDREGSPD